MIPKKKKTTKKDLWEDEPKVVEEIIKRAKIAVDAYEKYLLDKMNYNELAKIMQELRSVLPMSTNDKKKN
tara:strand:- start:309 stop:518 length:210 start_codon:yes stop_codon:yes gene_type:complete